MAKDLRGLFQNNRRRESHAVVGTVPFVLESADLREGKKELDLTTGDYTLLTIPANVLVTGATMVVEEAGVFDGAGTKVSAKLGTVSIMGDAAVDAAGVTKGTAASFPLLTTTEQDVIATATVAGKGTKGVAKLVISYVDYGRATMSYIGED